MSGSMTSCHLPPKQRIISLLWVIYLLDVCVLWLDVVAADRGNTYAKSAAVRMLGSPHQLYNHYHQYHHKGVPNGLLRAIPALVKKRKEDHSPAAAKRSISPPRTATSALAGDDSSTFLGAVTEVSTTVVKPKSKQQDERHRFYGITPQTVVSPETVSSSEESSTHHHKKRRTSVRGTMEETLEELQRIRHEMEALREELKSMKQQGIRGEEAVGPQEERRVEEAIKPPQASRQRQREFDDIGKEVEEWAEALLFKQANTNGEGESNGWNEIPCSNSFRPIFNADGRTSAYIKWMKDSRGARAQASDDREYPCLRMYSSIDAPLEHVCAYLSREEHMADYNDLVVQHRVLEDIAPHAKICWGQTPKILIVQPRQLVNFCRHRWLSDGTLVIVNEACDFQGVSASAFTLRGATYISRDQDDPERTRIAMITHANPGYDVPVWTTKMAIKAFSPVETFKMFHRIREGIKRRRPQIEEQLQLSNQMVARPGRSSMPAGFAGLGYACFWPNGGGLYERPSLSEATINPPVAVFGEDAGKEQDASPESETPEQPVEEASNGPPTDEAI